MSSLLKVADILSIANIIRGVQSDVARDYLVVEFTKFLMDKNDRFNPELFKESCR